MGGKISDSDKDTYRKQIASLKNGTARQIEIARSLSMLLAEVERLTVQNETRRQLQDDAQVLSVMAQRKEADAVAALAALTAERDALTAERDQMIATTNYWKEKAHKLTAERDALREQLQQAQDAAARHAAYISECVDSYGSYRP